VGETVAVGWAQRYELLRPAAAGAGIRAEIAARVELRVPRAVGGGARPKLASCRTLKNTLLVQFIRLADWGRSRFGKLVVPARLNFGIPSGVQVMVQPNEQHDWMSDDENDRVYSADPRSELVLLGQRN
jgi:hypothetical protein